MSSFCGDLSYLSCSCYYPLQTYTTLPDQVIGCPGQTVTLTVAKGYYPVPCVQWQISIDDGIVWTNIPNAYQTQLTIPVQISQNGYLYRAIVQPCVEAWMTNSTQLIVPGIITQPVNQCIPGTLPSPVTFSVSAVNSTIQWQVSTDGGATWTDLPGETNPTLNIMVTNDDLGNMYRVVVTSSCGVETSTEVWLVYC